MHLNLCYITDLQFVDICYEHCFSTLKQYSTITNISKTHVVFTRRKNIHRPRVHLITLWVSYMYIL